MTRFLFTRVGSTHVVSTQPVDEHEAAAALGKDDQFEPRGGRIVVEWGGPSEIPQRREARRDGGL